MALAAHILDAAQTEPIIVQGIHILEMPQTVPVPL